MNYIIMNHNLLENFQMGFYNTLSNLYYVDCIVNESNASQIKWSSSIADAHIFKNEMIAWATARKIWGIDFSERHIAVVVVNDNLMQRSMKTRSQILISEQFKNDLLKKNER